MKQEISMKSGHGDYIYAYDENGQHIIVIDAETGEKIREENSRVDAILRYLKEQHQQVKLRKFTLWCARQANTHIKPIQKQFMELAEGAIQQEKTPAELQQRYAKSEGQAIATDTIGLRQGSAKAPAFLASRECVNPDAFEGAQNAARFHRLWAQMNDDEQSSDLLEEMGPAASEDRIKQTEQRQVDHLLDLMGQ